MYATKPYEFIRFGAMEAQPGDRKLSSRPQWPGPPLGADIFDSGPQAPKTVPKPAQQPAKTGPELVKTGSNLPKPANNQHLRLRADISVLGADMPPARDSSFCHMFLG